MTAIVPRPAPAPVAAARNDARAVDTVSRPTRVTTSEFRSITYSGSVPHPIIAQGWEDVVPGAARTLLDQADKQAKHRRFIETTVVIGRTLSQNLGTVGSVGVTLYALYLGAGLVRDNKDIYGLAAMLTPIAALVWAFRRSTKSADK